MNRRKFALSWGRKIFFGISWPLSIAFGLIYLRSFILPESTLDVFYIITTFIGHYGLLNAIVYFFLFCPIVLLMPTYYISRIWSLILIVALNLLILLDGLSFSNYHLHLYSYISKLIMDHGISYLLGSQAGLTLVGVGFAILALLIWLRGEMVWRSMQGRFSNPVKNWYLFLIAICFVIGKTVFHYSDIHPTLAENFPLNYNPSRELKDYDDNRRFYYPSGEITCAGKQNPNIISLVVMNWSHSSFNPEMMPKTFHMKSHGVTYNSHLSVSHDADSGLYSLMYSLPSTYKGASTETPPAFIRELLKRKYEIIPMNEMTKFRDWISVRTGEEINSFYFSMLIEEQEAAAEAAIQEVILSLQKEGMLRNSYILITGAHGNEKIPLLVISPDRKVGEVSHTTTPYDVLPSLMDKMWSCKKVQKFASVGDTLDTKDRDWVLGTTPNGFKIIDLKNNSTEIVEGGQFSGAKPRPELIFSALKMMTKFTKPD